MWAQVKKFAPLAAIAGYLFVYMNKGWDKVVTDLSSITVAKIQGKYQNIMIIVVAGIALYAVGRVKMPAALKAMIIMIAYLAIGYNAALVIDPVNGYGGRIPSNLSYNPYRLGRR